jgi:hypothetical protein
MQKWEYGELRYCGKIPRFIHWTRETHPKEIGSGDVGVERLHARKLREACGFSYEEAEIRLFIAHLGQEGWEMIGSHYRKYEHAKDKEDVTGVEEEFWFKRPVIEDC